MATSVNLQAQTIAFGSEIACKIWINVTYRTGSTCPGVTPEQTDCVELFAYGYSTSTIPPGMVFRGLDVSCDGLQGNCMDPTVVTISCPSGSGSATCGSCTFKIKGSDTGGFRVQY